MSKNLDFNNPENREKALVSFKSLIKTPGWKLLEEIASENMELIKRQIITPGDDDETVEKINILRYKLRAYEDVISTPKRMIKKLEPQEDLIESNDDPYEQLEEKKKDSK
jgi:hypothetical protein